MPSPKLANLNLNQSLENFQFLISELLELSNLNQWSGTIIKDREERIREAALILAGQCIAILLNNLSNSTEAREISLKETQGWWRTKTRKNGLKTWRILTVGNVVAELKLPYVVEIKTRKDYQKKPKDKDFVRFYDG